MLVGVAVSSFGRDWSRPGVGQKKLIDSGLAFPAPGKAVRLEKDHDQDD